MKPWLAALALLAAAPGLGRDLSVYFWKAGPLPSVAEPDRFAGLALPEKAGFLTDAAGPLLERRYFETAYAVSPRILLRGPGPRLTVADVEEAASIERLCQRWKLRVLQRVSAKVALLERE